jgi:hypothetical protein
LSEDDVASLENQFAFLKFRASLARLVQPVFNVAESGFETLVAIVANAIERVREIPKVSGLDPPGIGPASGFGASRLRSGAPRGEQRSARDHRGECSIQILVRC